MPFCVRCYSYLKDEKGIFYKGRWYCKACYENVKLEEENQIKP